MVNPENEKKDKDIERKQDKPSTEPEKKRDKELDVEIEEVENVIAPAIPAPERY